MVLVSSAVLVLEEAMCGWHQEGDFFRSFHTVQLSVKGLNEPLYPAYGKSLPYLEWGGRGDDGGVCSICRVNYPICLWVLPLVQQKALVIVRFSAALPKQGWKS